MSDVLDGPNTPGGVFRLEVERAKIYPIVGRSIDAMKHNTHKAL
jgi:hypothetical protein